MYNKARKPFLGALLCLLLVGVWVGTAAAVTTFNLAAGQTTLTLPGGVLIDAWGFALISTNVNGVITPGDGIVKVPGETLVVPPAETTVTINLTNNLAEPVSLTILGQVMTPGGGPVWTSGLSNTVSTTGARQAGDYSSRVRSFAHEAPASGVASFTWSNFRAGTYLLQSGTNPAKQVQMGLYAAIKKDAVQGEAYPGVLYTKELVLVYSEIDPAIHAAVTAGTYGPGGTVPSSIHYDPKYYLINGMAYNAALPDGGGLNPLAFVDRYDRVLMRFINAGYETHVPQFLNTHVQVVAADGNPYTYPKEQYGIELPAGKTVDAIVAPAGPGKYSIHDAALHLSNNGAGTPGGMLAYYNVACAGDLNHNGSVDFADLALLRAGFGACVPAAPCPGDINKDGDVNFADLALLRANLGQAGCPGP